MRYPFQVDYAHYFRLNKGMTHDHVMLVEGRYFKVHEQDVHSIGQELAVFSKVEHIPSFRLVDEVVSLLKGCVALVKQKYPDAQYIFVKSWESDPYIFWLEPLNKDETEFVEKHRNRELIAKQRREAAKKNRLTKIMKENPELTKQVAKELDA